MTDLGRQKKSELLIGLNSSKLEPLVNLINETCSDVEDKDVLAAAMQFMLDFGIYYQTKHFNSWFYIQFGPLKHVICYQKCINM